MVDGQKIVIERELVDRFRGFSVEYTENWLGKGFAVHARMGGSSC